MEENWSQVWVFFIIAGGAFLAGWGLNLLARRRLIIIAIAMLFIGLAGIMVSVFYSPLFHALAFTHVLVTGGFFAWIGWRNVLWWSTRFRRVIKVSDSNNLLLYQRAKSLTRRLMYTSVFVLGYIFFLYLAFEFPWGWQFRMNSADAALYPVPLVLIAFFSWLTTLIYGRSNMIIADNEARMIRLIHLKSPEWIAKYEECKEMALVFHPMRPRQMLFVITTVYDNDLVLDEGSDRKRFVQVAEWLTKSIGIKLVERSDASVSIGR